MRTRPEALGEELAEQRHRNGLAEAERANKGRYRRRDPTAPSLAGVFAQRDERAGEHRGPGEGEALAHDEIPTMESPGGPSEGKGRASGGRVTRERGRRHLVMSSRSKDIDGASRRRRERQQGITAGEIQQHPRRLDFFCPTRRERGNASGAGRTGSTRTTRRPSLRRARGKLAG